MCQDFPETQNQYVCTCVSVHVYVCLYVGMLWVCVCKQVYVYLCMCACVAILCIYACLCVWVYTYEINNCTIYIYMDIYPNMDVYPSTEIITRPWLTWFLEPGKSQDLLASWSSIKSVSPSLGALRPVTWGSVWIKTLPLYAQLSGVVVWLNHLVLPQVTPTHSPKSYLDS